MSLTKRFLFITQVLLAAAAVGSCPASTCQSYYMDDAKSYPVFWPCVSSASDWQLNPGLTAQVVSSCEQTHGTTSLIPALKDLRQCYFASGHGETGGIMSLTKRFLFITQVLLAAAAVGSCPASTCQSYYMDDAKSYPVFWPCVSSASDWQLNPGLTAQVVSSCEQTHGTTSLIPALKDLRQCYFASGHGETGGIMSLTKRFLFITQAKKSVASDYHSEMDGPRFERWFKEQLLPKIEPRSIIVMDNASYHSVQLEKLPSTSSRKAEIQSWLTQKNIPWSNDQLKPELIQLVNQNKHRFSGYRIDALAKVAGHDIVRLPPYHCELNPIEMVWSHVKGYIAANNRSFTLAGVEALLDEAIALVTPENWVRDCAHVVHLEEEAWEQDGAIESMLDSIIITRGSDSSSCSDSSVSELSGIEEL
ncbi:hypothetical protein MTO96_020259 [Rhipicephalus appendiculatus]